MDHIRKQIGSGELLKAIEAIRMEIHTDNYINEITQIEFRLNDINKKNRLGIISNEELNIERNKISVSLLDLLSILSKNHWNEFQMPQKNKYIKPIYEELTLKYFKHIETVGARKPIHGKLSLLTNYSISSNKGDYYLVEYHQHSEVEIWRSMDFEFISILPSEFDLRNCIFYTDEIIIGIENDIQIAIFEKKETLENIYGFKFIKKTEISLSDKFDPEFFKIKTFKLSSRSIDVFIESKSEDELFVCTFYHIFSNGKNLTSNIWKKTFKTVKEIKFFGDKSIYEKLKPAIISEVRKDREIKKVIYFDDLIIEANNIAKIGRKEFNSTYLLATREGFKFFDYQNKEIKKFDLERNVFSYVRNNADLIARPHNRLIASFYVDEISGKSHVLILDLKQRFHNIVHFDTEITSIEWSDTTYHVENPSKDGFSFLRKSDHWTGRYLIIKFKEGTVVILNPETGEKIGVFKNLHPSLLVFHWRLKNLIYGDNKGMMHFLSLFKIEIKK